MKIHVFFARTAEPNDPATSVARAALLRAGWQRLHPGWPFPAAAERRTAQGRPYLPGEEFSFSLSHARGLAVLACTVQGRLGIDVAHALDATLAAKLDASFFTPAEQQALAENRLTALQLWMRKEAVLKADGRGLLLDPAQVEVSGASAQLSGQKYALFSTAFLEDYEFSLATELANGPLEPIECTEIFGNGAHHRVPLG